MPNSSKTKTFTAADKRAVADNPEWTRADFQKAKRFTEVFPEPAKTIRRRGKQKRPTKQPVSVRLDRDVLSAHKAKGPGWQSKMNSDLRRLMKLD